MKRYLLFAGKKYYPKGGFNDYQATSDSIKALKDYYLEQNEKQIKEGGDNYFSWGHIIDTQDNFKIVFKI